MASNSSFISIREAAARLGVHESSVRRYADRGLIGVRRLPSGVRRLNRADVEELAAGGSVEAGPAKVADLEPAPIWESDDELKSFLALTYSERDRDR